MDRVGSWLDEAAEAFAERDWKRAIAQSERVLAEQAGHGQAHKIKALASWEATIAELKPQFHQLSDVAMQLRTLDDPSTLKAGPKGRLLHGPQQIFDGIMKRTDAFVFSLNKALSVDPSTHRDLPPSSVEGFRSHWSKGLRKALDSAVESIGAIDKADGEARRTSLQELESRLNTLLQRIETPPADLPAADADDPFGDVKIGEEFGLSDDSHDGIPQFDLSVAGPMTFADDAEKLELMSLAEQTNAGQLLVTDAAGMIVKYSDDDMPVGGLHFPGMPEDPSGSQATIEGPTTKQIEAAEKAQQRRLEEAHRERQNLLKQAEDVAAKSAKAAQAEMQKLLSAQQKQAAAEKQRMEQELARAQQALQAAEQRAQQQAADRLKQEATRRIRQEQQAAAEARQRLAQLEEEHRAAKEALESQRSAAASGPSPQEIAADVAERVAMQIAERMQHSRGASMPSSNDIAQQVLAMVQSDAAAAGAAPRADAPKIAAAAAQQASARIVEQLTYSLDSQTRAGEVDYPSQQTGLPSRSGNTGRRSPAEQTLATQTLAGTPLAQPHRSTPAVPLAFHVRERVLPLEGAGQTYLRQAISAYETWVDARQGHPWPEAAQRVKPVSLHAGRLYVFQLQLLFETRSVRSGEAPYASEPLPNQPVQARDVDPWKLGVGPQPNTREAIYRIKDSYRTRAAGKRLSYLELVVQRAPRVEISLFPGDVFPPGTQLVNALRGAKVLAAETFEPFPSAGDIQRLFPDPLRGNVRRLAEELHAQETSQTKLRSCRVTVAEVPTLRLRYGLPGAPEFRRAEDAGRGSVERTRVESAGRSGAPAATEKVYETVFFQQPGGVWYVAPKSDIALEHAATLHEDATWAARHGRSNRTERLTRQLLALDPADAEARSLRARVRRKARNDYRFGAWLGIAGAMATLLFLLGAGPIGTLILAPWLLLGGAATATIMTRALGTRIGSRLLRTVLSLLLVAGAAFGTPWAINAAAHYDWLDPNQYIDGTTILGADDNPPTPDATTAEAE